MNSELDRLLDTYNGQCRLFPESVKYLYLDDHNSWIDIFNTTDVSIIRHDQGFYRYPIYSEDDLRAIVCMLEL